MSATLLVLATAIPARLTASEDISAVMKTANSNVLPTPAATARCRTNAKLRIKNTKTESRMHGGIGDEQLSKNGSPR